jgi:hypothetical protein
VQSVCEYCRSIVVRRDVNLERVGEVADLPPDPSPIQITTEGIYRNRPFVVAGRILYEYEQGGWNEWHIVFSDGKSGWLSDAMAEYAVTFGVIPPSRRRTEKIHRGALVRRRLPGYRVDARILPRRGRRTAVRVLGKLRVLFADPHQRRPLR